MRNPFVLCVFGILAFAAACGGANPYGYGREYLVRDEEEPYHERAVDLTYEDVRRDPGAFTSQLLGWFGVVTAVSREPSGAVKLALELRYHQPRHLCQDQFESSCKVTISQRAGGPFSTTLSLRSEDASGPTRLNVGSLVKVYGTPTGELDDLGGPELKTQWYRHWPHGAYVTPSGRATMRR